MQAFGQLVSNNIRDGLNAMVLEDSPMDTEPCGSIFEMIHEPSTFGQGHVCRFGTVGSNRWKGVTYNLLFVFQLSRLGHFIRIGQEVHLGLREPHGRQPPLPGYLVDVKGQRRTRQSIAILHQVRPIFISSNHGRNIKIIKELKKRDFSKVGYINSSDGELIHGIFRAFPYFVIEFILRFFFFIVVVVFFFIFVVDTVKMIHIGIIVFPFWNTGTMIVMIFLGRFAMVQRSVFGFVTRSVGCDVVDRVSPGKRVLGKN
mmetsp:Transcript_19499/g.36867  ORF Transcript_19499/g.36867 Transcript_19499/m.36867 type:complete len:258 (+) Transcript_19499:682-1455(+)